MPSKKGVSRGADAGVDAVRSGPGVDLVDLVDMERCPGGGFVPLGIGAVVPELEVAESAARGPKGARVAIGGRGGSRAAGPARGQIGSVGNNFELKASSGRKGKVQKIFRGKKGGRARAVVRVAAANNPAVPEPPQAQADEFWRGYWKWMGKKIDGWMRRDTAYQRLVRDVKASLKRTEKERREAMSCANAPQNFQQKGRA